LEERGRHLGIVVLPGVHDDVLDVRALGQFAVHRCELHEVGTGAHDRQDAHHFTMATTPYTAAGIAARIPMIRIVVSAPCRPGTMTRSPPWSLIWSTVRPRAMACCKASPDQIRPPSRSMRSAENLAPWVGPPAARSASAARRASIRVIIRPSRFSPDCGGGPRRNPVTRRCGRPAVAAE